MRLESVRSDRRQRIWCQLPKSEADHLDNLGRHLNGQSYDFAHEERPRARLGVKSARQSDLRVTWPRFMHLLFRHSEIFVRSLPRMAAYSGRRKIQDRISIFGHKSAGFKI